MDLFVKRIKGFTLIELLIVIAIIGILAVAFLPALTSGPQKARDAARKAAVGDIVTSLEAMQIDGDVLPAAPGTASSNCLVWNAGAGQTISQKTKKIPKDYSGSIATAGASRLCDSGTEYFYGRLSSNGTYFVAVEVELAANANAENGVLASTIRTSSNGNTLLGLLDSAVGNGGNPGFFYVVVK